MPLEITRQDHTAEELIRLILAIALVFEGRSRKEAIMLNGVGGQTLRDWLFAIMPGYRRPEVS